MNAIALTLKPMLHLDDEQFYELCRANPNVKLERTKIGELVVMPPTVGETGKYNFELYIDLGIWNRQTRLGVAFDSSTGFRLPNGAIRSPDVSWVRIESWRSLSLEQHKKFLPLCPDFALELVSESDDIEDVREKMQEYIDNGLRLGWLIDPKTQTVEVYRPMQTVEILLSNQ
jgi:Uma2 family endonuclease